jgi:tetratricopeptide repeat protein
MLSGRCRVGRSAIHAKSSAWSTAGASPPVTLMHGPPAPPPNPPFHWVSGRRRGTVESTLRHAGRPGPGGIRGRRLALSRGLEMTVSFQPPVRQHHPADVYHQAWQLLEERDPRQAIALLDPAIAAEPGSTGLRTLRAWAYFQSAQLQRAEQELSGLVDDCPTDLWARYALGRVLERQSKYADALPHMRLAAVMSGDPEHEAGMLRVERRLAEVGGSYDDLT